MLDPPKSTVRPGEPGKTKTKTLKPGDWRRLQKALEFIPADDRDDWLQVGMGIHAADPDHGYSIWEDWSKESTNFDTKDQERVWSSFDADGGTTIASIYDLAKKHGWQHPSTELPPVELYENDPVNHAGLRNINGFVEGLSSGTELNDALVIKLAGACEQLRLTELEIESLIDAVCKKCDLKRKKTKLIKALKKARIKLRGANYRPAKIGVNPIPLDKPIQSGTFKHFRFTDSGPIPLTTLENLEHLLGAYGIRVEYNEILKREIFEFPGENPGGVLQPKRLFNGLDPLRVFVDYR